MKSFLSKHNRKKSSIVMPCFFVAKSSLLTLSSLLSAASTSFATNFGHEFLLILLRMSEFTSFATNFGHEFLLILLRMSEFFIVLFFKALFSFFFSALQHNSVLCKIYSLVILSAHFFLITRSIYYIDKYSS